MLTRAQGVAPEVLLLEDPVEPSGGARRTVVDSGDYASMPMLALPESEAADVLLELPEDDTISRLQKLLNAFCEEIPEFIATDIVHREDGLRVVGLTDLEDYDSLTASAFYSEVLNASHRALLGAGVDEAPKELLVTTDIIYVLLRAIGQTPFMHMTLMHRTGNLGIARVVLRRYEPLFEELLPAH